MIYQLTFQTFYSNLYKLDCTPNLTTITRSLTTYILPSYQNFMQIS
uniref:Uncharacterized protein n=1 Tax=Anguilla anguilla TaxID=7936 RepID=A0A0E9UK69_ANGAN